MDSYLYLVTYASIVAFFVAIVVRASKIWNFPLNVRWEIYPVPHEGERAKHGGSRLEDTDWWKKEQHKDKTMELKFMLEEMIFIKALREHNFKLWRFSFPFHFGLYLVAAFAALVVVLGVLGRFGVELSPSIMSGVGFFGVAASALALIGGLGLLAMRLSDSDLKPYTNFGHIFNLLVICGTLGLFIAAISTSGWSASPFVGYVVGMLSFNPSTSALENGTLLSVTLLCASLLLAYIPMTHMSHFFVKWFTWHKIRWDDEPNVRGGRIEKMIEKALAYPVTWSAEHIKGDGKKTWADVATEELKSE